MNQFRQKIETIICIVQVILSL